MKRVGGSVSSPVALLALHGVPAGLDLSSCVESNPPLNLDVRVWAHPEEPV